MFKSQLLPTGVWMSLFASTLLAHSQTFESIHSFSRTEGGGAKAELVRGGDGYLYGTASTGGDTNVSHFGFGTVFRVDANGAVQPLVLFNQTNGAAPSSALALGNDGNFYGTTSAGGVSDDGTIFKMTPGGTLTTLLSFTNENGSSPIASLVLGQDGNFYGTASAGGTNDLGTVFKVTADGTLTTLVVFNGTNGASPRAELTPAGSDEFYGTSYSGGASNLGTVFKVTSDGVLTTLVSFGAGNGNNPQGKLILGKDGNFYGTTFFGGQSNAGTIFRMSPAGVLTTLFSFDMTDGAYPQGALVQAIDGNIYGTTSQGGTANSGTIFRLTPGGIVTSVFSFTTVPNGISPLAGLAQGDDGNLYGATYSGGNGIGAIYRLVISPFLTLKQSGDKALLSWTTNAVGFLLQSSTNLNSSLNWVNTTNPVSVLDNEFVVTNDISGESRFYRLKK